MSSYRRSWPSFYYLLLQNQLQLDLSTSFHPHLTLLSTMPREPEPTTSESNFLHAALKNGGQRTDGRTPYDMRKLNLRFSTSEGVEGRGWCECTLGETRCVGMLGWLLRSFVRSWLFKSCERRGRMDPLYLFPSVLLWFCSNFSLVVRGNGTEWSYKYQQRLSNLYLTDLTKDSCYSE